MGIQHPLQATHRKYVTRQTIHVYSILKCRPTDRVIEPYFSRHRERDIYVSLLQKTDPPTPEHLLKAALVRRAVTNVNRIMRIREDKPAMQNLLQKGSIGDDLWNSLLAAEKELEAEVLETMAEANTFVDGWGQIIFQTATEILHNDKLRSIVEQIGPLRAEKGMRNLMVSDINLTMIHATRAKVWHQSQAHSTSSRSGVSPKIPRATSCFPSTCFCFNAVNTYFGSRYPLIYCRY